MRDRVVQAATKLVIEPIFEADFKGCSYGFRPKRSATDALETIRLKGGRDQRYVVDGDIKSYFDSIDHEKLLGRVQRRISDRRVLKLLRQWLKAGVMVEGAAVRTDRGSLQGGVISPLLSNIYLDALDGIWERQCRHLGTLVRYCDDFVVLCRTRDDAEESLLQSARVSLQVAVGEGDESNPDSDPGAYEPPPLGRDERHPGRDPGDQSCLAWLGQLLPHG